MAANRKFIMVAGLVGLIVVISAYFLFMYPPPEEAELTGTAARIDTDTLVTMPKPSAIIEREQLNEAIEALEFFRSTVFYTREGGDINVAVQTLEQYVEAGPSTVNRGEHIDGTIITLENMRDRLLPLRDEVNIATTIQALERLEASGIGDRQNQIAKSLSLLRNFEEQDFAGLENSFNAALMAMKDFRRSRVWKAAPEIKKTISFMKSIRDWQPEQGQEDIIATIQALRESDLPRNQ